MNILVLSIGSRRRKATLRYAVEMARSMASKVSLRGVVRKKKQVKGLTANLRVAARDLEEAGVEVDLRIEIGDAQDLLMKEIRDASHDMIVMGALSGKKARRAILDSVAKRVLERSKASVLIVKGNRRSILRVLVCSSGAGGGRLSIWTGAAVACAVGAEATLLHVLGSMPSMYTGLEQMEETLEEFLQSGSSVANELRWGTRVMKAECRIAELKVRRGLVPDEILREAERGDYDLIVLGSSQAANGFTRLMMGDLAPEIVSRARRPVLVVRPPN